MAFPDASVALVDDFNRSDGAINAGAGSTLWESFAYGGGTGNLAVASNQLAAAVNGGAEVSKFTHGPDFDAVVDVSAASTNASNSYVAVFFCLQNASASTWSAYWAILAGDVWKIRKRDTSGSSSDLAVATAQPILATGDKIGIRRIDDQIEVHHYTSGAWGGTPRLTATDSEFQITAPVAIDLQNTDWRLDNLSIGVASGGGGGGGGTATTLYVDADNVAASDSQTRGQVTASTPLKTILKAAQLAQASPTWADTIAIKPAVNANPSDSADTHVYAGFTHGTGSGFLSFGGNAGNQPIVVKGIKADGTQPANDSERPRWRGFDATGLANWHFQDLHFGYEFQSGDDVLTIRFLENVTALQWDRCMWTGGAYQITNAGVSGGPGGLLQWNGCEFTSMISTFLGTGGRRLDGVGFRIINSSQTGEDYRIHFEWNDCWSHHVQGEDAFQIGSGAATQADTWCHWNRCRWSDVLQLPDASNPSDIHTDGVQILGGPEYVFDSCQVDRCTDFVMASDFHNGLIRLVNCKVNGSAIDVPDVAGIMLNIQGTDRLEIISSTIVHSGFGIALFHLPGKQDPTIVCTRVMLNSIFDGINNAGVLLGSSSEDKGNLVAATFGDYVVPGTSIQGATEFGTTGATNLELANSPAASPAKNAGIVDARIPSVDRIGRARDGSAPDIGCHESPTGATIAAEARPPLLISRSPSSGAAGVSPSALIDLVFYPKPGDAIDPATVTGSSFFVVGPAGVHLPAQSVGVTGPDGQGRYTLTLHVAGDLLPWVTYTATATAVVSDTEGSHIGATSWSFQVAGPTPDLQDVNSGGWIVGVL